MNIKLYDIPYPVGMITNHHDWYESQRIMDEIAGGPMGEEFLTHVKPAVGHNGKHPYLTVTTVGDAADKVLAGFILLSHYIYKHSGDMGKHAIITENRRDAIDLARKLGYWLELWSQTCSYDNTYRVFQRGLRIESAWIKVSIMERPSMINQSRIMGMHFDKVFLHNISRSVDTNNLGSQLTSKSLTQMVVGEPHAIILIDRQQEPRYSDNWLVA